jgi:hypothetical protein
VDNTSDPKINDLTIDYQNPSNERLSIISSSELSNRTEFMLSNDWDFSRVWTYVDDINWNYPVLRSIYGNALAEIDITVYNPTMYGDGKVQLGDIVINGDEDIFMTDDDGNIYSDFGTISDISSTHTDTTMLSFKYTVKLDKLNQILISNKTPGLLVSVKFGERLLPGEEYEGEIITETLDLYTEYATRDNSDVVISELMDFYHYSLVVTFEKRNYSINVDYSATANAGATIDITDRATIVLVHSTSAGVVDYAYSVTLANGEDISLNNIYNGIYDNIYTGEYGETLTRDDYGTWSIYVYLPMFYKINLDSTFVIAKENTLNPTINGFDPIGTVLDGFVNIADATSIYLGSFSLDTLTRDISLTIMVEKNPEFWLNSSVSNY